jgi:uncharacterized protein with PQ loop repeat
MVELLGWVAGILFAICAVPQAYQSWKDGHSDGVNYVFLYMWLFGEILMQIYVVLKHGMDLPLLVNYWLNTLFILVILKYKHFPVRR